MTTIAATIVTQLDGAQTDGTGFAVSTLAELGLVLALISIRVNAASHDHLADVASAPRWVGGDDVALHRRPGPAGGSAPASWPSGPALSRPAPVVLPRLWILIGVVAAPCPTGSGTSWTTPVRTTVRS